MVSKLELQAFTSDFESHWVPHSYGFVPHPSKKAYIGAILSFLFGLFLVFCCCFFGGAQNNDYRCIQNPKYLSRISWSCSLVSWVSRKRWSLFNRGVRPPLNECPVYNTKQYLCDNTRFCSSLHKLLSPRLNTYVGRIKARSRFTEKEQDKTTTCG